MRDGEHMASEESGPARCVEDAPERLWGELLRADIRQAENINPHLWLMNPSL
jgi:hypothetical protein